MKRYCWGIILALALCITSAYASGAPFADMQPSHWAYHAVIEAYNDEVIAGVEDNIFAPDGKVTLAQFLTILTRAFYGNEVEANPAPGVWYSKYYDAAAFHHLFNGVANKRDSYELTREDMAQLMYNVMNDQGVNFPGEQKLQAAKSRILDFEAVNVNRSDAVAVCYFFDLISGVDTQGRFAPKENVTRAQATVVYTRLKQVVKELGRDTLSKTSGARSKVGFSEEYMSSPYYRALQEVVLTGDYRQDIIAVALSQVGYHEGDMENQLDGSYQGDKDYTEYGRYFGNNGSAWCSEFASWCARMAKIPISIFGNSDAANVGKFGAPYFTWAQTIYAGGTYTPRSGDLALFAWYGTSATKKSLSHTAIVYNVERKGDTVKITLIDGNSKNTVKMSKCIAAVSDGDMGKGHLVYFVAPEYE